MMKIVHLNPHEVIKRLTLGDCATRTVPIDWEVKANVKMHEGALRNCAIEALVKYEKHCPECLDPFSVRDYAPDLLTEDMDREQIWCLMTREQRPAVAFDR